MRGMRIGMIGLLLAALLVSPLAALATGEDMAGGQAAQAGEVFDLPGLDGEVSVRYDPMGVPHIYATTPHDLVMTQGFVHAADRWWQMEWFRHQGAGRLSEIMGSSLVGTDKYLRTFGLPRNAQNDLDNMPDDIREALEAYSAGVNAWLAGKEPADVAVEYTFLNQLRTAQGSEPLAAIEPWTPFNSMTWLHVMSLGLSGSYGSELLRLELSQEYDAAMAELLTPGYDYATMPLILEPGREPAAETMRAVPEIVTPATLPGLESVAALRDVSLGSNNWVVSGDLTESGLPLLANDPHLSIQMPSIWYEVGLHCAPVSEECPYDVYGFSFAGTPYIIIGHNQQIGWGVTNVGTDVQDLYALELNPDNPLQYKVDGAWEDMTVLTETITPSDGDPVTFDVHMTRFGPVVSDVIGADQPLALRWVAAEPNRDFRAFLLLNKAQNWDEFQEAISYFDMPAQNFVYADREGNIGYITSGRIPMRAEGHNPDMPADGTTAAFEWQGYVDPYDNPRLYNPAAGYIVTANNAVVAPEDFPYPIATEWAYGYRAARIEELLQAEPVHSPDTFAAIQFDNFNWAASLVVPRLAAIDYPDDRLDEAAAWLAEWDFQNDASSPQAALFNAVWRELAQYVFDELPYFEESFTVFRMSLLLDDPNHPVWHNAEYDTSDPALLMEMALNAGLYFMELTYGEDRSAWRWGELHVAQFRNAPLGQLPEGVDPRLDSLLPLLNAIFNRETEASGGGAIVNATGWDIDSGSFLVGSLPSMRMILDLSDWDASRFVHTTGQSGMPASDHYDDMIALWAVGDYHPASFSAAAVEANTAALWTLRPAD